MNKKYLELADNLVSSEQNVKEWESKYQKQIEKYEHAAILLNQK